MREIENRISHDLIDKIKFAQRSALQIDESREKERCEDALLRAFISGANTLQDFTAVYDAISDPGILLVDSLEELREVLVYLKVPQDVIDENVNHEEAHCRATIAAGGRAKVGLKFVKRGRHTYFKNALTSISLPSGSDDDSLRTFLFSAISAPGDDMSESDLESLPAHKDNFF